VASFFLVLYPESGEAINTGMKDYYAILQVTENDSRTDIQKAYRRLALQFHPDVNKSPDAHERFCEITEAYEFIMNHWPEHVASHPQTANTRQEYTEYRQTEAYERFRREAREKAHRQAKMRYEKFRKQHEAFQESGINDIALIFTVLIRLFSIPFCVVLFLLPMILAWLGSWQMIFLIFLMWPFAVIIGWYIHDNWKHYLLPGSLYYSPYRIRHMFTETHPSDEDCYYSKGRKADSKSYSLDLLKLKDLKLNSGGFRQHNVNYINKNISILIPRSRKAFVIHALNGFIKILSILLCLIFLDLTSIVWRLVIGAATGGIISLAVLIITQTRSHVSYLFSINMIIRLVTWVLSLALVSRFTLQPFNIITNESIYFVITAIVIFDCFLMQLIDIVLGKKTSKPVITQYQEVQQRFSDGYIVYNDIPVLSVIYPFFKWIFG
jgi:hypothetical protein